MTTTYDPANPRYLDQADLREEMGRVFELCHGCRLCFNLCPAFPSLFDFIDRRDGDVGMLTADERNQVVDECYQCKLCYLKCPYVPPHEWELDFPRMMMRAQAVRHTNRVSTGGRRKGPRQLLADQVLARTDLVGRASVALAPLANVAIGTPGSLPRKLTEKVIGVASERLLPPYARERFSTWFTRRKAGPKPARAEASIFPTCFVEYMDPGIGKDLVKVLERNQVGCTLAAGTVCCGAPLLHGGDVKAFVKQARRNVASLAAEVRAGRDVVVAQPTCGYVVKKDYPRYVKSADADAVAEHTYGAAEYLMRLHRGEGGGLDTVFEGEVAASVAYHASCHLRAQEAGLKGRDLVKLTGAKVTVVDRCSGIDGTWGYRAENYELARQVAGPLKQAIERAEPDALCGECHLANVSIRQETGRKPLHPVQLLARAYGMPEE